MAKISLRRLFFNYLMYIMLWLTGGVIASFVLFQLLLNMAIILPANDAQIQLPGVLAELGKAPAFSQSMISENYDFLLSDTTGKVIATNVLAKKQLALANIESITPVNIGFQKVGERHETKFGVLVISYSLTAEFANPYLRQYLPKAEWLYFMLSFVVLISGFLWLSSRFGKQVNRELAKLVRLTKEIGALNLIHKHEESNVIEIEAVFSSIYQMEQNLSQALQAQWQTEKESQEILQALAHDIKTPVTVISGNLELLKESELSETQQAYVDYAENHVARMNYYVKEITDLANLNHKITPNVEELKLSELLINLTKLGQGLIQELTIVNHVTAKQANNKIGVIAESLYRALQNVLLNAQEHSIESGSITLEYVIDQGTFAMIVRDNGPGFSIESLKRGKEIFFTSETSRTAGKHYGMGLAIADQAIKNQGGQLVLENYLQNGEVCGAQVSVILRLLVVPSASE